MTTHYDPEGDYAGASFLSVGTNIPSQVDASDLFAVTLLRVDISPRTARRLLTDEQLLTDLEDVPTTVCLEDADSAVLDLAGRFYDRLKRLFVNPSAALRSVGRPRQARRT